MVTQIRCSRSNTQTRHSAAVHGTHLLAVRLHSRNCRRQTKRTYVVTCCLFRCATRFQGFSIDTIKAEHAARLQHAQPPEINLETTDCCSGRDPNSEPQSDRRWRIRHKRQKLVSSTQRRFDLNTCRVLNMVPGGNEASQGALQGVKQCIAGLFIHSYEGQNPAGSLSNQVSIPGESWTGFD